MTYTKSFPIKFEPIAVAEAMVIGNKVRFTVLTSRLLRLEYSPDNEFEDRPSQAFWYRKQAVPEYECSESGDGLTISTEFLKLTYSPTEENSGFSVETLSINLKQTGTSWHYGDTDGHNLLGTARTLDNVDGALKLEEGLLSRSGYAVYDDSSRLVFNPEGWLEPRNAPAGTQDLYFFGYEQDAAACLQDFALITGPAPMLPRWSLGNWWSRYWAYSADELLSLMDEFQTHQVPLSVCIVDMDWHLTETGNASSGWTGYTWNRELFPEPKGFIAELHRRGLKTALNMHPAEGIHPHEEKYNEMAAAMGIDPDSEEPVQFDIANPEFTRHYFELLHHPYEADGVDFWWMDWQQGTLSGLPGLDPLWWINHLHFNDLGRDGKKRPFTFSRWGGLGNHRYPIGFSGDAIVTWESLAFQPYFTATAANVNYGWWSHDIGGHMFGVEEPELYARWVQFGVFSPIMRLHSTKNKFHERRPWGWDAEVERVTSASLRFRHQLIPYLYTMAWRNHIDHLPLVRPMYHEYPSLEPAYRCPDQYMFGSELLAAPYITPMDTDLSMSRQVIWLPEGDWYDFFSGAKYEGDGWHAVYGGLEDIPVFAKAGAIVPLATKDGLTVPDELTIHIFPGADNEFNLYEDDGLAAHSLTNLRQNWSQVKWSVTIAPIEGEDGHLPPERTWNLCFRGAAAELKISSNADITTEYDADTNTLQVRASLPVREEFSVALSTSAESVLASRNSILEICQKLVIGFRMETQAKEQLFNHLPDILEDPTQLSRFELKLTKPQLRSLLEIITSSGWHRSSTRHSLDETIVLWNNQEFSEITFKLAALSMNGSGENMVGSFPKFALLTLGKNTLRFHEGALPAVGNLTIPEWFNSLSKQVHLIPSQADEVNLQFVITGRESHSAYIQQSRDHARLIEGTHPNPNATITAEASDWLTLLNGDASPEFMWLEGKINTTGDLQLILGLASLISLSPPSTYQARNWRLDFDFLGILRERLGSRLEEGLLS
jgi:alpha-glucosidase (family GH31 glycosyl hydrolase)